MALGGTHRRPRGQTRCGARPALRASGLAWEWRWAGGAWGGEFIFEPLETAEVVFEGYFGVSFGAMVDDADRPLPAAVADDAEEAEFLIAFSEMKDLCGRGRRRRFPCH